MEWGARWTTASKSAPADTRRGSREGVELRARQPLLAAAAAAAAVVVVVWQRWLPLGAATGQPNRTGQLVVQLLRSSSS